MQGVYLDPVGAEPVIIALAAQLERMRPWPQLAPMAA
jgi:hypothetical protein